MVVKRFIISISVLFFYALLLQAKNEVIDHGQFLCSYYYCYSKDTDNITQMIPPVALK